MVVLGGRAASYERGTPGGVGEHACEDHGGGDQEGDAVPVHPRHQLRSHLRVFGRV